MIIVRGVDVIVSERNVIEVVRTPTHSCWVG